MIYLDAATTLEPNKDLIAQAKTYLDHSWGNVSGSHSISRMAKSGLEVARENVAKTCGVSPDNIVFTSGASDALNIVIQGFDRKHKDAKIFCSMTEHDAVKKTCDFVNEEKENVIYLKVDSQGQINIDDLDQVDKGDLVCLMATNNETGVAQDIESASKIIHEKEAFLLIDAVQSYYSFNASQICEYGDYAVFSGHKLGGLQGIGLLVIKDRKSISSLMFGGSQEWELRPGTTPSFLCDSFSKTFVSKYAQVNREHEISIVNKLNEILTKLLSLSIENIEFNSCCAKKSPHINSVRFSDIEAQMLVTMLDDKGICVSKGSACASGASTPSRVLTSMGMDQKDALSTIRISLSSKNTEEELVEAVNIISECIKTLRSFSKKDSVSI